MKNKILAMLLLVGLTAASSGPTEAEKATLLNCMAATIVAMQSNPELASSLDKINKELEKETGHPQRVGDVLATYCVMLRQAHPDMYNKAFGQGK